MEPKSTTICHLDGIYYTCIILFPTFKIKSLPSPRVLSLCINKVHRLHDLNLGLNVQPSKPGGAETIA